VLRDEAKAREFYVDFLGFTVDWKHRFEPGMPLYMQVSRAGIEFHLGTSRQRIARRSCPRDYQGCPRASC
jgi:catechol 2,3-dioxygenase-like lactoylglutathione lyase family enzyme